MARAWQEWVDADSDSTMDPGEMVTYLAGPRGVECRVQYDSQPEEDVFHWYIYDGLGSVLAEVDEDGNVLHATTEYDVYGAAMSQYGSTDSKNGFVGSLGHPVEPATGGLIYMRARWYDPATGRFTSEDPMRSGENWYAYCGGNPIGSIDPTGESAIPGDEADTTVAEFAMAVRLAGQILVFRGFGHIQQGNMDAEAGRLVVYVSEAFPVLFGAAAMSGGYMLQAIGGRERMQGFQQVATGAAFQMLATLLMYLDANEARDYKDDVQAVLTQ